MKQINYVYLILILLFSACEKDTDDKYYNLPPNTGGTMELQGGEGGTMAKNSVYVDLSAGTQTSIERISWHLAFHCGAEFAVKLNNTIGSRATEAPSNIAVTSLLSEDDHNHYVELLYPAMGGGDFTTADKITCDTNLSETVIKKEKTYIYCSGDNNKEIYKVRVTEKNSSTYTVSYAKWNESEAKTIDIIKNSAYNFVGASFTENKQVDIQPEKDDWDFVWSRNTYISAMAAGVPFIMSDIVFLNSKAGVMGQEILVVTAGTYDEYNAEKAASVQFSPDIDVIGSDWRNGGGPTGNASVKADRFYVIKDALGNIYKLGFVSMNDGTDGGKRGYPEIKFSLLINAK